MTKPLTIVADIRVEPEQLDFVQTEFMKMIAETRTEAGCLQYDLHQNNEDPAHFLFFENWESRELWLQHMESAHVKAFQAETQGMISTVLLHEMTKTS